MLPGAGYDGPFPGGERQADIGAGDRCGEAVRAALSRPFHLENFEVGKRIPLGPTVVGTGDLTTFALAYDPQPMHADPEAAARGPFGGLIASGWQTASLAMRMICDAAPLGTTTILGSGVDELRWPNPVRPGDTLGGYLEFLEARRSVSRPDRGVVRLRVVLENQRGETVLTMLPSVVVPAGGGQTRARPSR